jgi:hypothetical protein
MRHEIRRSRGRRPLTVVDGRVQRMVQSARLLNAGHRAAPRCCGLLQRLEIVGAPHPHYLCRRWPRIERATPLPTLNRSN